MQAKKEKVYSPTFTFLSCTPHNRAQSRRTFACYFSLQTEKKKPAQECSLFFRRKSILLSLIHTFPSVGVAIFPQKPPKSFSCETKSSFFSWILFNIIYITIILDLTFHQWSHYNFPGRKTSKHTPTRVYTWHAYIFIFYLTFAILWKNFLLLRFFPWFGFLQSHKITLTSIIKYILVWFRFKRRSMPWVLS